MSGLSRRQFLWAGGVAALAPRIPRRDPVRELRHLVRGPVLTPRDSRGLVYDERWQRRRPRAVVQALDNLRALDLVTADGRLHHVDARSAPDLFWACRGGGGAFGVATRFELRVHPARRAAFFSCSWPAASAQEALAAWQRWAPHTDHRLTSVFTLSAGRADALGQF